MQETTFQKLIDTVSYCTQTNCLLHILYMYIETPVEGVYVVFAMFIAHSETVKKIHQPSQQTFFFCI